MSQPTPGDVHVNRPLTNISIAYMQNAANFIADQVFPNIPVSKQSDLYYLYDRGYFNRDEMEERAPGTESKGGGYKQSTDPYYARVYAFHHDIPDERRSNADTPLQPDREATALVSQKALIKRERLWATKYFQTGIWQTDRVGVASSPTGSQFLKWNDANSTPIEDIRSAKTNVLENTGFEPNTLVIGQRVADALIDHPDIVDRVKYGQSSRQQATVELTDLEALFKIERILVMKSIVNTAQEGQASSHSFIGGNNALLCYSTPTPGIMTPSAGYTFSWNGFLGANALGARIKRFRLEAIESDRVEIQMAFDQKRIAAELGSFFSAAI